MSNYGFHQSISGTLALLAVNVLYAGSFAIGENILFTCLSSEGWKDVFTYKKKKEKKIRQF